MHNEDVQSIKSATIDILILHLNLRKRVLLLVDVEVQIVDVEVQSILFTLLLGWLLVEDVQTIPLPFFLTVLLRILFVLILVRLFIDYFFGLILVIHHLLVFVHHLLLAPFLVLLVDVLVELALLVIVETEVFFLVPLAVHLVVVFEELELVGQLALA